MYFDKMIQKDGSDTHPATSKEEEETLLFLHFFIKEHRKKCNTAKCFCKGDEVFRFRHCFSCFQDRIQNWMYMDLLFVLENVLNSAYLLSNKKSMDILYCMLYFKINYLGKSYEAYNQLMGLIYSRRGKESDLRIEEAAILDEIEKASEENLTSGYLALRKFPELVNQISSEKQISFAQHIIFLNLFKNFKLLITKVIKERSKFLNEIHMQGNLESLFNYSTSFYDLSQKVKQLYHKLDSSSGGDFAPLLLIYSWYMHSVFQNKIVAAKVMSAYTRKYHKHNLNIIFGGKGAVSTSEFACVYVGQHEGCRHVIRYCTSNILSRLGYTFTELESNDLSVLLPQPIRDFHSQFFQDDQLGRKRFMMKESMDVYPINRKGRAVPCTLTIRYNCTIVSGLEILGVLEFDQNQTIDKIALLDREGMITCTTSPLRNVLNQGNYLHDYNMEFALVVPSMNLVAQEKLALKERTIDYDYVFMGDKFASWTTYYEWRKSKNINLLTMDQRVKKYNIEIKEKLIFSLQLFYYVVRIGEIDGMNGEFRLPSKRQIIEGKSIRSIMEFMVDREGQHINRYQDDGEYLSQESIPGEIQERVKKAREFLTSRVGNNERSKIKFENEFRRDSIDSENLNEIHSSFKQKSGSFKKDEIKRLKLSSKLTKVHQMPIIKKKTNKNSLEDKLNRAEVIRTALSKKIVKAKEKKINATHKSSGSSITVYNHKEVSLERVIHEKIRPKQLHLSTILLFLMIVVLCFVNVGSVAIKVPILQNTNADLKEQLIVADIFSWEIWGQIYSVLFLDFQRGVKEGKIPNEICTSYGYPDLIERSHFQFQRAAAYQYDPDKLIDPKLRNVSFPNLFNYEAWVKTEMLVHFYEFDYPTNSITWKNKTLHRKVALQMMTAFALDFVKRNYSILEGQHDYIPKIEELRDADPDEEFYRRNLNGDMNKQYFLRSLDFYEYLKNVGQQNEQYLLFTMITTLFTTLLFFLAFFAYSLIDLAYMRKFYGSIFIIQVNQILLF